MNNSSGHGQRVVDLESADWQACESAIRQFEKAWQRGPPSIDAFLPTAEPLRSAALLELVQIDLELRLKRGEAARVESYLQQFPELTADRDAIVELLKTERELRSATDRSFDPQEYGSRFPELAPELETIGPQAETHHGPVPTKRSWSPAALPQLPGLEFQEELGRGGMGVVYLARQTALKRLVAVKMLRGGAGDSEQRDRFRTEMEAAARLKHPHIVQIYEVGQQDGQPYCVLEYVSGGSLQEAVHGQPLPAEVAAKVIHDLALAVQHAHERGIVHRDLKPANVLIGLSHPEQHPQPEGNSVREALGKTELDLKIADFGLARELAADSQHTQTGAIVGTPAYMSPEQAAGQSRGCGPATDIYSLGVILYELLTGRPPFQGASVLETLEQVRSHEPVPPRALTPRTPRDLNTICLKCLHKEPDRRYVAAVALAADLAAFAAGSPISARPVGIVERAWKAARRRPSVAALATAVVLVASVGLATGVYQYRQTSEALVAKTQALANEQSERAAKETALKNTQESLADVKAFSQFVVKDIVAAARPSGKDGGLGVDATVREALDAATANMAKRFAGQPRAEVIAHLDLGDAYRDLGEHAKALVHFQEAVRLRRQLLGPDHAATIEAENRLGFGLRALGRVAEAITLHEELLSRSERVEGPESQTTQTVLYSLIRDYTAAAREEEAIQHSKRLVALTLASFGPDHDSTFTAQHQYGLLLSRSGQWREALPILEQVVEARARVLGPDDTQTLTSISNLASILRKQGNNAEALRLYEQNLERRSAKLGPEHPHTLVSKAGVAQMYTEMGRFQEAIELALAAHEAAQAKLGSAHVDALEIAAVLAQVYKDAGRLADALPLREAIYHVRKEAFGVDNSDTMLAQGYLAAAYRDSDRGDDAVKLSEETLAGLRKKLPATHPKITWAQNNLGLAYKQAGKADLALPLYKEVVTSLTQRYGPSHSNTLTARNNLGGALSQLNRVDESIKLTEETLSICDDKLGADHQTTLIVAHNLGVLYQSAKRDADSERLFRRAYEGRKTRLGIDHEDTLESQYRLAAIYLLRKDLTQAEPLLLDCHQRLKASPHAPSRLLNSVESAQLAMDKVRANPEFTPQDVSSPGRSNAPASADQ